MDIRNKTNLINMLKNNLNNNIVNIIINKLNFYDDEFENYHYTKKYKNREIKFIEITNKIFYTMPINYTFTYNKLIYI